MLAMASLNTYTFKLLGGDESKYTRDVDDVAAQQLAKEKAAEKKAEKDKEEKRRKETEEFETAARAAILAELQEVIDELDTPEKAAELARLIKPKGDLMIKKFRDDALYDLEEMRRSHCFIVSTSYHTLFRPESHIARTNTHVSITLILTVPRRH